MTDRQDNAPLTPQTLRWMQALGLGPLYVRRNLLKAPVSERSDSPPVKAVETTRPEVRPTDRSTARPPSPSSAGAAVSAPGTAREQAIARMNWEELQASVQDCRACKLGSSRHQAVFGSGATHARWMIVGEAPGAEEDRQGQPFVGAAGQLLDAMLQSIGLDRQADDPQRAVYVANVLKCRPPGNRNPQPEEVAQCVPWLQRQVALLRPTLILALGRFAAHSLLGSQAPINHLRGQVHAFAGIAVIVSYHPAYLLRNPADKARVWRDLCFARDTFAEKTAATAHPN
ncbi:uracil-DNA glycosylase [Thiomonas bhubaneswarensis]|uniref:Type-4 uracil-DNA glycosylase n=1 Tax=Thiomonas bhubaneswarensis TaxID=339866 RepID=A0A0K6HYH7_9BURK|nr:uracil-DNA glycosylase [Thiomonas bhubaneswarensis]CUA95868.1 uracil-DNA glycosylase, family 4 [Thiomonas bhubaneswarensis]